MMVYPFCKNLRSCLLELIAFIYYIYIYIYIYIYNCRQYCFGPLGLICIYIYIYIYIFLLQSTVLG